MSQKYEKLKTLLKELFQLDQPNLDFGLYRIMHAKSAEVSQFLDNDLLQQVKAAFGQYKTADKAELEKKLSELIASIEAAGMNPDELHARTYLGHHHRRISLSARAVQQRPVRKRVSLLRSKLLKMIEKVEIV